MSEAGGMNQAGAQPLRRGLPRAKALLAAAAGLAGVIALAALLAADVLRPAGPAGPVPVTRAAEGRFVRRVPAEGNLQATRATPLLAPRSPGQLRIAWLAPEGSRVKAGDVVVRFDATEMEKGLADARDALDSARLKIEKQRAEDTAEAGRLAADEHIAAAELAAAQRFQKYDELIFSRSEIIESQLDEKLARERERHAKDARRIRGEVGRADLALLAIEQDKARYRIAEAERGLTSLTVMAPHAGVLVYQRDWRGNPLRVGDLVWDDQPLAEIPDLAQMEAEVFVLEADAGGLAVGKPAVVEVESAPGQRYAARISRVDALAKPRLRGSPVQYFGLTLTLARTDRERMKPGARVRASLLLDDLPRAVSVPRQAVFEREGQSVVYRRGRDGGFAPVPVDLGPSGLGKVAITRGLAAGDTVALRDPTRAAAPEPAAGQGTEPGAGAGQPGGGGAAP